MFCLSWVIKLKEGRRERRGRRGRGKVGEGEEKREREMGGAGF